MKTDYDVVVVGSGAGGGSMAYALSRKGLKVLLLEAGPRFDPFSDYKLDQPDWERTGFPHKEKSQGRYAYAEMQALDSVHDNLRSWNAVSGKLNKSDRRRAFGYHHVRGYGGSTLAYTGEAHRLHPDAMNMRNRFGKGADWPLDYASLESYYCEAERISGVAGNGAYGGRWRSDAFPVPAHELSYASRRVQEGAGKLGLKWEPNARAALSKPYDGRPNCNYCANCTRGCPRKDKGSMDVTFLRKAELTGNCIVRSGVTVLRIEPGSDDKVRGLYLIDETGVEDFLETPELVIACGAIETPRLLLYSKSNDAPDGLANESGQVGRNFMETISWTSSALHPENMGSYRGLPADSISWDFNAPDAIPGVVGGCRFSMSVSEAGLNGPIAYSRRVAKGWGRAHKDRVRELFGHVLSVGSIGESLPNERTFVDLDPVATDVNGGSLARIHSYLDDMALARLSFMAKTCRDILKASGATELVDEYGSYDYFSSTHVMGTCRMGLDPEDSVVDSHGRSHRWKNLTIMDASVFPSSGGGESPSLTIQALALRAADSFGS